jgi:hypothetical protein
VDCVVSFAVDIIFIDMERSGELNLSSNDREPVDIQQETSQGIQNALYELHRASLESIPMG